jgi:hypothetical protein
MRLFVVGGSRRVGLPDGAVFHAHSTIGHSVELLIGLVIEVSGDVLGRWVQPVEWLQLIKHLVINPVNDRPQDLLEQLEIEQQPRLVQCFAG